VTAVPLALLALVLAALGISNWTDFNKSITEGKNEVKLQLEAATQSAKQVGAEATALQAQYADLEKQFGDVLTLASDVRDLAGKVQRLERIQFHSSAELTTEVKAEVVNLIANYRVYLQSIGYHAPKTDVNIFVDPNESGNTYYDGQELYVTLDLVTTHEAIIRTYTKRVLQEVKPGSWDQKVEHIIEGLADYLTCSYQGNAIYGANVVQVLGGKAPTKLHEKGYLRNLLNNRQFVEGLEPHDAGEVWGGVFWEMRRILNCKDDIAKCPTADAILLATWNALEIEPDATVDVRFAQRLIQSILDSAGADQAGKVRDAFARRGLLLKS
jgi:hypothetical protein